MPDVCSPDRINLDLIDSFEQRFIDISLSRIKRGLEESKEFVKFVRNFRKMIFDRIVSRKKNYC